MASTPSHLNSLPRQPAQNLRIENLGVCASLHCRYFLSYRNLHNGTLFSCIRACTGLVRVCFGADQCCQLQLTGKRHYNCIQWLQRYRVHEYKCILWVLPCDEHHGRGWGSRRGDAVRGQQAERVDQRAARGLHHPVQAVWHCKLLGRPAVHAGWRHPFG